MMYDLIEDFEECYVFCEEMFWKNLNDMDKMFICNGIFIDCMENMGIIS